MPGNSFPGGYSFVKNHKTTLIGKGAAVTIPGEYRVDWLADNEVFLNSIEDRTLYRLVTLQGNTIAEYHEKNFDGSVHYTPGGTRFFIFNDCAQGIHWILDQHYKTISVGQGYVRGVQGVGLFEITDGQFFGYMDTTGTYIFRVSLLDNMPD